MLCDSKLNLNFVGNTEQQMKAAGEGNKKGQGVGVEQENEEGRDFKFFSVNTLFNFIL